MKDKHERFVTIAERRIPRAVREIRLIGNLANVHNYEYTPEEAQRILSTLERELKLLKARFAAGQVSRTTTFKL